MKTHKMHAKQLGEPLLSSDNGTNMLHRKREKTVTMVTCKVMNMLLKKLMAATNACKQTQTIREECFDCHTVFIHTQRQVLSHTQKNKIH